MGSTWSSYANFYVLAFATISLTMTRSKAQQTEKAFFETIVVLLPNEHPTWSKGQASDQRQCVVALPNDPRYVGQLISDHSKIHTKHLSIWSLILKLDLTVSDKSADRCSSIGTAHAQYVHYPSTMKTTFLNNPSNKGRH